MDAEAQKDAVQTLSRILEDRVMVVNLSQDEFDEIHALWIHVERALESGTKRFLEAEKLKRRFNDSNIDPEHVLPPDVRSSYIGGGGERLVWREMAICPRCESASWFIVGNSEGPCLHPWHIINGYKDLQPPSGPTETNEEASRGNSSPPWSDLMGVLEGLGLSWSALEVLHWLRDGAEKGYAPDPPRDVGYYVAATVDCVVEAKSHKDREEQWLWTTRELMAELVDARAKLDGVVNELLSERNNSKQLKADLDAERAGMERMRQFQSEQRDLNDGAYEKLRRVEQQRDDLMVALAIMESNMPEDLLDFEEQVGAQARLGNWGNVTRMIHEYLQRHQVPPEPAPETPDSVKELVAALFPLVSGGRVMDSELMVHRHIEQRIRRAIEAHDAEQESRSIDRSGWTGPYDKDGTD